MNRQTKSVFTAIIGRPNVGKSSLLNRLVGEKVAIVTPKPQTTRNRITGIVTVGPVQYVFLDTPGMHHPRTKLGQRMAKTVQDTASEGDVILMLFEPDKPLNEAEEGLISSIRAGNTPALAAVNKADTVPGTPVLSGKIAELEALGVFDRVFSVSAITGEGSNEILSVLETYAVEGPHFFADDAYTDLPEKQLVAEIIREKLLVNLQEEIPHGTAVEVDRFHERDDKPMVDIEVTIFCERKSHKGMIIGKGGAMLKTIASQARADCEEMLGIQVNLKCWVKVREGWRNNEAMLKNMGFSK